MINLRNKIRFLKWVYKMNIKYQLTTLNLIFNLYYDYSDLTFGNMIISYQKGKNIDFILSNHVSEMNNFKDSR